ncbi:transcriptional regulator [Microtetraspora sp. NBRC 13810]|uniref:helix-turn-helix domain-containing protein n=1 Tax=Microtetraspora sp. NBRC 13810 TaxID=3030990 RepID=UPI0024A3B886|nr:helix-turn-helix transcriptional regulator [Microtetraspora sp. NBRC 13810]GLW05272.1 transcriptional regulator [Microtetraspora sp. NBRC 13810]
MAEQEESADGLPRQANAGPTALRIQVGGHLRRLREHAHISREDAGWAIRASESKISRLELGRSPFKERDVADLLTLYGVADDDERAKLLDLSQQASRPGWWHRHNDVLPHGFGTYLGLEEAASVIRVYESHTVPALLQTRDYARARTRFMLQDATGAEIERLVDIQLRRQRLLTEPGALRLWAVLDEAALRRLGPDSPVMREQLDHLIHMGTLPNVTIQIVPFATGTFALSGQSYTVLRFAEPDLPDVVFLEQPAGVLYMDKREEVETYLSTMERLADAAAGHDDSAKMITSLLG